MHAFSICTCSAQLSMFHMEKHSRNTLIITIIIKNSGFILLCSAATGPTVQEVTLTVALSSLWHSFSLIRGDRQTERKSERLRLTENR